jgi:mycofactocin radical SAM maturase
MTPSRARRYAAMDYLDIQVSIDGATAATNDPVRGAGSFAAAVRAMERLAEAGFERFKVSVVITRQNAAELGAFVALTDAFGAELRLTRLRPSGRGAAVWHELRPTPAQLRDVHRFLLDHPQVLTGDSFFHLGPLGDEPLAGLNLCGAGRVVCLIDPVGDVYACPFVMHPDFKAGSVRAPGGFAAVWRESELFTDLRRPVEGGACNACGAYGACHGGCMAAKFFTGLPLDGPDPECVLGHGEALLAAAGSPARAGRPHGRPHDMTRGHTHPGRPVPVAFGTRRAMR